MEIILALVLGTAFGFALNRVGATNPNNIINMLRLSDLSLMKTIILAIGFASLLLFAGLAIGVIAPSHLSVKAAYWGVLVGGAIMGLGFAIAGYCPGTGLAAAATGRKDAWFFVLGGLVGAFVYALTYSYFKASGLLDSIWGGKVTFAVTGADYPALLTDYAGWLVGGGLGALFIVLAFILPNKISCECKKK